MNKQPSTARLIEPPLEYAGDVVLFKHHEEDGHSEAIRATSVSIVTDDDGLTLVAYRPRSRLLAHLLRRISIDADDAFSLTVQVDAVEVWRSR